MAVAPPTEIYLVVDNARSQALTRAWERFDDPSVESVDLHFRASTDVALVAVHLRVGRDRGRWIGLVVASGVAVIDPGRMAEGDRRAFFATYLRSYQLLARECRGVAAAMTALRFHTATHKPGARGTGPAAAVDDPDSHASARLGSAPPSKPGRGTLPSTPTPPGRRDRRDPTRVTALGLGAITGGGPAPLPPPPRAGADTAPIVRPRARDTVPMDPPCPAPIGEPALTVRFLRGGQWAPARLRSLSARGAYLVTGALPRVGDDVHIALDVADSSAVIRGTVYHVTTPSDAATTGSSGFAARFAAGPSPARTRLLDLLHRARAAGVVIRPPPSRTAVRFPVRWPVEVRDADQTHCDALDVSLGGLFISTSQPPPARAFTLVIPIDVGDPPIEVEVRVARSISAHEAAARGLSPGHGLQIVAMPEGDRVRWSRFLQRVELRSTRTVLVAATPHRLEAIARVLTDAGYAVNSTADAGALIRLVDAGIVPDLAVIDDSLMLRGVTAGCLEQMFTARQVPCITVRGEPSRARMVVDRLLAVSAVA